MTDQDKSREQLLDELAELRRRVVVLEASIPRPTWQQKQFGNDWWRSLLSSTPVFVVVLDHDYRIQFLNRTDSGLPAESLIGMSLADFTHPEAWEEVRTCVDRVFATGKPDYHRSLVIRPDDQEHWYEGYFGPILGDGQVAGVSLIATNVTARTQAGQGRDRFAGMEADPGERVRADLAHRESERRLLTLISNLPGIAYRCKIDADWTMEFVSEGCFLLSGYHRAELLHNRVCSFGNLIHPDDRPRVWDGVQEALARRQHFQLEYRISTATGEEKWVWEQGVGVYSYEGHPVAVEGFITDVTERKRAEEALMKAHGELEERVEQRTADLAKANKELAIFRKLADASNQGFGMAELSGRITYANPAMLRLLGEQRVQDVVGKSFVDYAPVEYRQMVIESIQPTLLREGRWSGEAAVLTRQGTVVPVLNSMFLIHSEAGSPQCLANVVTDITERKKAEEALRQAHDELRAIHDGMVDGLLIADVETGRFVRANASLCRMLGYSKEEVLSRSIMDIHPAKDLPAVLEAFEALAQGRIRGVEDLPVLRQNGTVFYANISSNHIVYNGRRCAVGFFRDVTERKQAEEAIREERNNLKHLLQSSDHERQLIAYEIHDGLAQQLAGALMQFETFAHLRNTQPKLAEDAFHAAVTMLRQGHFEARRLIAGVRPPILDESGVVEAIAHLVHEQGRDMEAKIKFDSEVDFDRLASTLENAIYRIAQEGLTNACQHSKSKRVRVSLLQHGNEVRIEIRDWGVGFDVKAVPKNRFGLEGIRQRARLLGGKCRVRSRTGQGTLLVVHLPVVGRD